jgi:hypothetical protein
VDQRDHPRTAYQGRDHSERRAELDVPRYAEPVELRFGGCDAASARGSQVGQRAELLQGQLLADGVVVTVDRAEQAVGEQNLFRKLW